MGKLFVLMAACALSASALPHYFASIGPGGSIGTATMILNASQTGAAIDIFGTLPSGTPRSFVLVGGGLVFNDTQNFPAPDFDFHGTVYFSGFCCGSFTVDTGGQFGGTWTFDQVGSSNGQSGIDYSFVGLPPADIPEPSTFGLIGLGAGMLVAFRRRR